MPNVDLPTSQHRHHHGSRNADCSQNVNKTPGAIRGFLFASYRPVVFELFLKAIQSRRSAEEAGTREENACNMKAPGRSRRLYLFRCGSVPTPHLAGVIDPGLCVGPKAHQHTADDRPLTLGERGVQPHIVTDCVTHVGGSFSCQDGSSVPVLITVRMGCDSRFYRTGVRF